MKFKVGQKVVFNYNYVEREYGLRPDSRRIVKRYSKTPMIVVALNGENVVLTPNPFYDNEKYYHFPLSRAHNVFKSYGIHLNEELFQL